MGETTKPRTTPQPVTDEHHREGRLHSSPGQPIVLQTEFDVAAYTRDARGRIPVQADEVDFRSRREREDLAFLWRLESAALSDTRALLASWTGNEARITAFVATWAFERLWLGHAVRDLLTADGSPLPEPLRRGSLRARLRRVYVDRGLPLVAPVWTNIVGESVTAGQMVRLWVQEKALQAAYRAMLPRLDGEARHVVEEIVERRDEIIRFFRLEATARIHRSAGERRAARLHLHRGWRPLRIVGVADPDERLALASIFRTREDRARLREARDEARRVIASRPGPTTPSGGPRPTPGLLSKKGHHGIRP